VDAVSSEALISEALDARQTLSCRVDTLLVAADAASSAGRQDVARAHVAEALSLAEPRHMIRRFVDGGPRVAKLVVELSTDPRLAAGPSFSPFFAARVRDAREVATRSRHADGPPVDGLVGQLSVRELDVLGLLAERLSYSEIGDALFVSRNTVKSHVQHIYTKLGVASRAQAVDLGQTLGLISS
jgi:LuxR family maltose regulon positive regulatory protein